MATTALSLPPSSAFGNLLDDTTAAFSHLNSLEGDALWTAVRQAFPHTPGRINLNNGAVSPHPTKLQHILEALHRRHNFLPAKYLMSEAVEKRESSRRALAGLLGCSPEELAIARNATEALTTIINGFTS